LLQCRDIRADDSFFGLGGNSLLATKLVAAVRNDFDVDLGVREVFELGTVTRLAERIENAPSDVRPRLVPISHDGPLPLSAAQRRAWCRYRANGNDAAQNISFAARITGPCDVEALVAAVRDVVTRHEVLRTVYREINGVPYQFVTVFDLEGGGPLRAAVLSTPDEHVVSLVFHHIAADDWSGSVLFAELGTAYRARRTGRALTKAPLRIQYADYAAWQAVLLSDGSGTVEAQRDYWRTQLADLSETGLTPDFPRPTVLTDEGDAVAFVLDGATRSALTELSKQCGSTDFMLLQTAVAVALHKAGNGFDIPVLAPFAGRTEAELEHLIGAFGNLLVLRNDLGDNPTVREMLRRTRDIALTAYAHSDLPFDRVVDTLGPVPRSVHDPLFGVAVHMREALPKNQVVESGAGGVTMLSALEAPIDVAHADLSVLFSPAGARLRGHVVYRTDLYRRATAERLAAWLDRVLRAFADDPGQRLRDIQIADRDERSAVREFSLAAGVSVLDPWRDPVAIGAVGDVYTHVVDERGGVHLRRSDKRARWTADGELEYVATVSGPQRSSAAPEEVS
jgi:mycobactin peptide synthetase MbtE